jgi:hypothetical protein
MLMKHNGHDFQCETCRKTFTVPFDEYHGQFDHPPSEPECDECREDQGFTPWVSAGGDVIAVKR